MNVLITLTGQTCSGKTTLQGQLGKQGFHQIVSFTTRPPRTGEVHTQDYYFLNDDEVDMLIGRKLVAEYVQFGGFRYGILGSELETKLKEKHVVVVVEPHGVTQLRDYCNLNDIKMISVFVSNPDMVTVARMLKRFREDDKADIFVYAKRIISMLGAEKSWHSLHDYDMIVDQFDSSNDVEAVASIIQMANSW